MSSNGATLVQLQGITKVFYTDELETHALSDVAFEIARGEYVSITGPSGCGKTTLLSILGLLEAPTAGEYLLHGPTGANLPAPRPGPGPHPPNRGIFHAFKLIG